MDNLKSPYQDLISLQSRSGLSLVDQTVCHVKVQKASLMHHLLIGPGPRPQMMCLVQTAHPLRNLRDLEDHLQFLMTEHWVMSLIRNGTGLETSPEKMLVGCHP